MEADDGKVKIFNKLSFLAVGFVAALVLAGCSTGTDNIPVPTPGMAAEEPSGNSVQPSEDALTDSESESDASGSSELSELPEAIEPLTAIQNAVTASCEKAQSEGAVEMTPAIGLAQVLVPKDESIDGYSAAYQMGNELELIYNLDSFSVCQLAMEFWMAEEAGADPAEFISVMDYREESFIAEVSYPDLYTFWYQAELDVSGYIASVTMLNGDGESAFGATSITYGYSAAEKEIIQNAYNAAFPE